MHMFSQTQTRARSGFLAIVIFVAASFCQLSLSFADSALVDIEKHLANLYYSEFHEVIEIQLDESGLAPTDIEKIVNEAADKYARCIVAALSEMNNPDATRTLDLLSQGLSAAEIDDEFGDSTDPKYSEFFARYEVLVGPCKDTVSSELGLPPR